MQTRELIPFSKLEIDQLRGYITEEQVKVLINKGYVEAKAPNGRVWRLGRIKVTYRINAPYTCAWTLDAPRGWIEYPLGGTGYTGPNEVTIAMAFISLKIGGARESCLGRHAHVDVQDLGGNTW